MEFCALIFDYAYNPPSALTHTIHLPSPAVAFIKAAVVPCGCHGDQPDAKHREQQQDFPCASRMQNGEQILSLSKPLEPTHTEPFKYSIKKMNWKLKKKILLDLNINMIYGLKMRLECYSFLRNLLKEISFCFKLSGAFFCFLPWAFPSPY